MLKTIIAAGAILASGLGSISAAEAQGKLALRFADSLPPTHLFTTLLAKPWMDEVTRRTNGAVTFEHYPSEQLGKAKDMLSLAQSGVADIAFVTPIYISDKLPLSGVVDLPGGFSNSCEGVKAYWSLATAGGILAAKEFAPNGIRVLMAVVQPPFQVFTTRKKISSVEDLAGLKLRTAGGAQDITATRLKIVSVKLTAPDTNEALRRGTIDGGILAHVSIGAYGLASTIKFGTEGENFGSAALTWSISEAKWKTLPKDVQDIMVDAGRRITLSACDQIDKDTQRDVAQWREGGMSIVALPPAERDNLRKIFDEVGTEWAKGLDGRGKPGSETLNAFRGALAKGS